MWILISIFLTIILIAIIFLVVYSKNKNSRKKQEPDYYMFFILGIVWTGAGVSLATTTNNFGILAMGIIFLILGLVNKDKWKTNHKTYKDLTPKQKKIKLWILAILGILILALFLFWFLF